MMEQDTRFYEKLRKKPILRVMAVISVVLIIAMIVAVIVTGIMGSKYFMGCIYLMMVMPVLIYAFLWIGRLLSDNYDEKYAKMMGTVTETDEAPEDVDEEKEVSDENTDHE